MNMTFDAYTKLDDKISRLPGRVENYGLTEEDIQKMESNPEKYYKYAMYLLNQPYYGPNAKEHKFDNENALPQQDVYNRLNRLIQDFIQFEE